MRSRVKGTQGDIIPTDKSPEQLGLRTKVRNQPELTFSLILFVGRLNALNIQQNLSTTRRQLLINCNYFFNTKKVHTSCAAAQSPKAKTATSPTSLRQRKRRSSLSGTLSWQRSSPRPRNRRVRCRMRLVALHRPATQRVQLTENTQRQYMTHAVLNSGHGGHQESRSHGEEAVLNHGTVEFVVE